VAEKLGLSKTVDFRSSRTMHASLMRRNGARLEVARDNMGHAGSSGIQLPHEKTETVTDRLSRAAGGVGYENLLIDSPREVTFFGNGEIILHLVQRFGGYCGGLLPDKGHWGLSVGDDEQRVRITDFVLNSLRGS
jgi:hypothetical protein